MNTVLILLFSLSLVIPFISILRPRISFSFGILITLILAFASILAMLRFIPMMAVGIGNFNLYFSLANSPFIFIISIVELIVFAISLRYLRDDKILGFFIGLTVASINSVLFSDNIILFLMFWESMTVSGYLTIGYKKESKAYPPFVFIAFGELSTIFLTVGFAAYYFSTGSMTLGAPLHNPYILMVIILGFLFKMGIVPLQMVEWLPIAHGNSPVPGSILFSAAMTTLALYGIVSFVEVSTANIVIGLLLMGFGSFSLLFGSIFALSSENSKMLPAYSTVENSGAMIMLVGLFISWKFYGNMEMEIFTLLGVIVYATAHAWAKSAVFVLSAISHDFSLSFSKGSKLRPFSKLSGAFAVISLMGLAPIGGGIGEWFLLESLFISASSNYLILSVVAILAGALAALGAGITIPTFTKFFNYLSTRKEDDPMGTNINSTISTAGILIISISILSPGFIYMFSYMSSYILGSSAPIIFLSTLKAIPYPFLIYSPSLAGGFFGFMSPVFIIMIMAVSTLVIVPLSLTRKHTRSLPVWNGGIDQEGTFNSFAYANVLRIILRKIYLSREEKKGEKYVERTFDIFWLIIVDIAKIFTILSGKFARAFMNGRINAYIIYIIAAFFTVLILLII